MSNSASARRRTRSRAAALVLSGFLGIMLAAGCSTDLTDNASPRPSSAAATKPADLDGSSMPPWPAPTDVPARVATAGLNLGPMGMAEHYHPQLQVVVAGSEVQVPAGIGVDPHTGAMSAVHTHEVDGTIHVEAGTASEVFTLGQLFTQWGVKLTSTQIGGVHAKAGQKVTVTSNAIPVAGDPNGLRLQPDQKIVLRLL